MYATSCLLVHTDGSVNAFLEREPIPSVDQLAQEWLLSAHDINVMILLNQFDCRLHST